MLRKIAMIFGTVAVMVLAVGCSDNTDSVQRYEPSCDEQCQAQMKADIEYLTANFPTREQTLQVRACATAKTGYDEFPELPADFVPPSLTQTKGTPVPASRIQEEMPFRLVERVLVAVGQRKPLEERIDGALNECVFELGFEDRFYTPRSQESFRPRNS